MIAQTPSRYAVLRKEEEQEDNSKMPTNITKARLWHLLFCRYALLGKRGVILLQMSVFGIVLLIYPVLGLSAGLSFFIFCCC